MKNKQVCRICLKHGKIYETESFQMVLNEIYEDILNSDTEKVENPKFCDKCTVTLEMALEFKAQCTAADEYLYPYLESVGNEKPSLTEIYCKSHNVNNKDIKICRICLNPSENCESFDNFIENQNKEMIEKYIPTLHENNVQDSYLCDNCSSNVAWFISYIMKCLESEKKLLNYIRGKNTKPDSNIQISLDKKCRRIQCKSEVSDKRTEYNVKVVVKNRQFKYFNCINCNFKSGKSVLQKHSGTLTNNSKPEKFKCVICSFMTSENERLVEHLKNQHSCNNERLHCELCPYNTKDKEHLFRHWRSLHMDRSEVKMFKCSVCTYECIEKSNLRKHMIKHVGRKEYKCSLCDFSTSYDESLKLHIRNHSSTLKKFKCDICNYSTKLKSNLNAHTKFVHNDNCKKFACHICDFKTTRKGNLVYHVKKHDDTVYFKCEHCDFQSKYNGALGKHVLFMHSDKDRVKTYDCDMCTYKTVDKGNLTRHLLVHNTKIKLKCSICDFSTKYKLSLKTHMELHNIKKPKKFKCDLCHHVSAWKSNLAKHVKLVHAKNGETYECYKCNFKAKLKSVLISHLKTHNKK